MVKQLTASHFTLLHFIIANEETVERCLSRAVIFNHLNWMFGSSSIQLYNRYCSLYSGAQCSVCSYLVVCGSFVRQDTKSAACQKREWTKWGRWRRICLKPLRFARTCPWAYFTGGRVSNCPSLISLLIRKRKNLLFIYILVECFGEDIYYNLS